MRAAIRSECKAQAAAKAKVYWQELQRRKLI
jgi:hypothetical protein